MNSTSSMELKMIPNSSSNQALLSSVHEILSKKQEERAFMSRNQYSTLFLDQRKLNDIRRKRDAFSSRTSTIASSVSETYPEEIVSKWNDDTMITSPLAVAESTFAHPASNPLHSVKSSISSNIYIASSAPNRELHHPPGNNVSEADSSNGNKSLTSFFAIADVPYTDQEESSLRMQLENLKGDAKFVLHGGDVKKGSAPCTLDHYERIRDILTESTPIPVFLVPGDNEWNDCSDPDMAWKTWKEVFGRLDERWNHTMVVIRQPGREENFAILEKGTLFVGLKIVGGTVANEEEWKARHRSQFQWTRKMIRQSRKKQGMGFDLNAVVLFAHAKAWSVGELQPRREYGDFFRPLKRFIHRAIPKSIPVLYLHGDGHEWIYEPTALGVEHFSRVQLTGGTHELPLKVTIGSDSDNAVFAFGRALNDGTPLPL